jgi:hypothetical protein
MLQESQAEETIMRNWSEAWFASDFASLNAQIEMYA